MQGRVARNAAARRRAPAGVVASAFLSAAMSACASVDRATPFTEFTEGRYAEARARYEANLAEDQGDQTLDRNLAGTVALVQGDVEAAHRHFLEAFTSMEDLSATTGETIAATVGSESAKRWKGDPYERCMNAYYLGVTSWLMGDVDAAAAAFKSGLLRDADSEKGEAQSDFGLLWFLLGEAQRDAAHEDRGERALATAHALLPQNPWAGAAQADANVLLVLDVGLGPVKVATGPHGSLVQFRRRPYTAAYAEISADGRPLGRTARAVDVFQQAATRGAKTMDSVNQGKAMMKDAAVIGGSFVLGNSGSTSSDIIGTVMILLGMIAPAEADLRQWDTLPGEVHVLTAKLDPGEHLLRVDVCDVAGRSERALSCDVRIVVRPYRTAFAWVRATPAARRPEGTRASDTMASR